MGTLIANIMFLFDSKIANNEQKNKGFTLIELLVVIAIIGILAAIVLVSVNDMRKKVRNAKRVSDTRNYINALEMVLDRDGKYPDPGATGYYCLGDYGVKGSTTPTDSCRIPFPNSSLKYESQALNSAISEFIPGLPADEYSVNNYNGYIYYCWRGVTRCTMVYVIWFVEGGVSCGIGEDFGGFDGNNLCWVKVLN